MNRQIAVFDTTLRDGAQAEDISFSVEDKLKIVTALDELGVSYVEAGNPVSNPKDKEFFQRSAALDLKNSRLTAFGSTRKKGIKAEDDATLQAVLRTHTPTVAVFGKSWDLHVRDVIRTTPDENLRMIRDTMAFFKRAGRETLFDAEHFFDGFKTDPDYAMKTLEAAVDGGADWLVLCDTNGGCFPEEIFSICSRVRQAASLPLGIHCHDDGGMAVANTIRAVEAGITQVQGTWLGFGERTGNANLSSVIPNLQLKRGYRCLPENRLPRLTATARFIAEVANIPLSGNLPYVGRSAFAHKGGMHVDGVLKRTESFEHIDPQRVGNRRRILMSEVSGRSAVLDKIRGIDPDIDRDSREVRRIVDELKDMEYQGYQFEAAECSFKLLVRRRLEKFPPFFKLEKFTVVSEPQMAGGGSSAIIKVEVNGRREITAAQGGGPVHALDRALRKALEVFYPGLKKMRLTDYKVRVLNPKQATAARVRVLIESTDGREIWTTVGVSSDIIEASCIALTDSIEYKLMRENESEKETCERKEEARWAKP